VLTSDAGYSPPVPRIPRTTRRTGHDRTDRTSRASAPPRRATTTRRGASRTSPWSSWMATAPPRCDRSGRLTVPARQLVAWNLALVMGRAKSKSPHSNSRVRPAAFALVVTADDQDHRNRTGVAHSGCACCVVVLSWPSFTDLGHVVWRFRRRQASKALSRSSRAFRHGLDRPRPHRPGGWSGHHVRRWTPARN
jgi:hypothetical protein